MSRYWRLYFAALLVAVTALSTVGFLTNRVAQSLTLEKSSALAADLVLERTEAPFLTNGANVQNNKDSVLRLSPNSQASFLLVTILNLFKLKGSAITTRFVVNCNGVVMRFTHSHLA